MGEKRGDSLESMNEEPRLSAEVIPEIFHSYSTKTFFDRCIECDTYLLDKEIPYFIEKAIKKYPGMRGYDVIVEYAICINCADKIRQRMSTKSMMKLTEYMHRNVDPARRTALISAEPDNPLAWTDECLIKGLKKDELMEYQLYAQCLYDRLLLPDMPYMISHVAIGEMADLLSAQTLGEMDDFIGKHFGPPSEVATGPRNLVLV